MSVFQKYILFALVGLSILCFSCGSKSRAGVEAGNTKVAGVVLDANGKPVSSAIIRLYLQTKDSLILLASDTTDAQGVYHLEPKQEGAMVLQVVVEQRIWKEQTVSIEEGNQSIDVDLPQEPEGDLDGDSGTITDNRDGQMYRWVRIGTQIWLAKNLNYSGSDGNGGRAYQLGWCYGSDVTDTSSHVDLPTCEEYGRLYSYKVALVLPDSCDSLPCSSLIQSSHQGICPDGWRLPDTLDLMALDSFVRAEQGDTLGPGFSEHYLKIASLDSNWNRSPFESLDPYGFSMKPGGIRGQYNGIGSSDASLGSYGYIWTTSVYSQPGGANTWEFNSTVMVRSSAGKLGWAVSVRCMR